MSTSEFGIGTVVVWATKGEEMVGSVEGFSRGWYELSIDGEAFKARGKDLSIWEGDDEEEDETGGMAKTLARYKAGYEKTVAPSGAKSQNCGDEIAEFLAPHDGKATCLLADEMLELTPGWHWERYENLNEGQKRMNAGNKIRARYRKAECRGFFDKHGVELPVLEDEAA